MLLKPLLIGPGFLVLLTAGLAVYRALRQSQTAKRQTLLGPNAIDEAGFVKIGGIDQWISIRGEDRCNPVLVVLHGGPGAAFQIIGYEAMRAWEADFTVVQWDQRGAGRTFGRNGALGSGELTIDRMTDDGVEVICHALARTGQEKVLLLGVSWGSILGVHMARRSPERIHAYIGAGQVVDMEANEVIGYEALMRRLRAVGETKAATRLTAIGPPPYADFKTLKNQRAILMAHPPASERGFVRRALTAAMFAPGARLKDIWDWRAGEAFSIAQLYPELAAYSDRTPAPVFPVPVVIIQGAEDFQTPTPLARAYFESIVAPSKTWVVLPGGGHNALFATPTIFHRALQTHVHPLARSIP